MRRIPQAVGAVLLAGAFFVPVGATESAAAAPCIPAPPLPPTPAGAVVGDTVGAVNHAAGCTPPGASAAR